MHIARLRSVAMGLLLMMVVPVLGGCGAGSSHFAQNLPPSRLLSDTVQTLTLSASPGTEAGTTVPTGGMQYTSGTLVTLTPTASPGWVFQGWDGPDAASVRSDNTVVMDSNKTIIAKFTPTANKWNFLVYLDGDNNLESEALFNFNQMEKVGSSNNVQLLVLFDRSGKYDTTGGWTGTRLYRVTKDDDTGQINSEILVESPWGKTDGSIDANMADYHTLQQFITWCAQRFPANRTALTLWDHGSGVFPRALLKGVATDDSNPSRPAPWNLILTDEIQLALANARALTTKKIDVIQFDACLEQLFEVAYQLRSEADYMAASEALVPGDGNDYTAIARRLVNNPDQSPRDFAAGLVQDFNQYYLVQGGDTTFSAIDVTRSADIISAFAAFATEVYTLQNGGGATAAAIKTAAVNASGNYDPSFQEIADLYNFANGCPPAVTTATALKTAIQGFVITHLETGVYSGVASGLAITLPTSPSMWSWYSAPNQYLLLAISQDMPDWYRFLTLLSQ